VTSQHWIKPKPIKHLPGPIMLPFFVFCLPPFLQRKSHETAKRHEKQLLPLEYLSLRRCGAHRVWNSRLLTYGVTLFPEHSRWGTEKHPCPCHAKSVALTNRVISPGIYNVSNGNWLFDCLASLNSSCNKLALFLDLSEIHLLNSLLEPSLPSRVLNDGGHMAHTCNLCLSWCHDSSWHP